MFDRSDGTSERGAAASFAGFGARMDSWVRRLWIARSAFILMLLLILPAIGLFGPVVLHMNDWLYGIGQDGTSAPGNVAQRLEAFRQWGFRVRLRPLLGVPFPYTNTGDAADPLWWYAGLLLATRLSPVGAVNILVLTGLGASAIAMFLLLRRTGQPSPAAYLGGLIYGYCPIRLAEAQEHFTLLDGYWLAFECALLLAVYRSRKWRWSLLLGVCIALTDLDNPYLGHFGGIFATGWFMFVCANAMIHRNWNGLRSTVLHACVALTVLIIIVLPTQWSLLSGPKSPAQAYDSGSSLNRSLGDIDRLSLRWWNFLLPSPENPLLGPLGRSTFNAHLGVDTVTEQSTMIGYIALILAIAGVYFAFRPQGRVDSYPNPAEAAPQQSESSGEAVRGALSTHQQTRELAALALVCICASILFGLPPEFRLGPILVLTPPYFVHALLPEIRTTSRIDLMIQLGIAILASIGTSHVLANVRSLRRRQILAAFLALAILLEYTNVPPWRYVKLLPAPPLYQWLASLTPQQAGIVVQYPIAPSDMAATPLYAFYAYALHHHPLFNGVIRDTPPDALRRNMLDLLNPTIPAAWAALGVQTVTIETAYYAESYQNVGLSWLGAGTAFAHQLPEGLALRHTDAGATGYAVTAAPAAVAAGIGIGFGDATLEQDGREWRWTAGLATVWLDNVTAAPVRAVLWTMAHNNATSHDLGWSGYLPAPVPVAVRETPIAIAVTDQPGMHSFVLSAGGSLQPLQGGNSSTPVALELRSLEPAPVRSLNAQFMENGTPRWTLTGMSADACSVQAGETLDVALLWHVDGPTSGDQTVFLHLIGPSGTLVAQADGRPNAGTIATSQQTTVPDVSDVHALILPRSLPPGPYQIQAGLYNAKTMTRLQLAKGGDAVFLGSVNVIAPSNGPQRIPCSW